MKKKAIFAVFMVFVFLFVSCGNSNSSAELQITIGSRYDYIIYLDTKYMKIKGFRSHFNYALWNVDSSDFNKIGNIRDTWSVLCCEDECGEILFIELDDSVLPGNQTDIYIREDMYPLDIYCAELSSTVYVNKKPLTIDGDTDKGILLDSIVDCSECIPNNGIYTESNDIITVFSLKYEILSRNFPVYQDDDNNVYIMIDDAYLLKITNTEIVDNLQKK